MWFGFDEPVKNDDLAAFGGATSGLNIIDSLNPVSAFSPLGGSTSADAFSSYIPSFGVPNTDPYGGSSVTDPYGGSSYTAPDPYGGGSYTAPDPYGGSSYTAPDPYGGGSYTAPDPYGGGSYTAPDPYGGSSYTAPDPYGGSSYTAPDPYGGSSYTAPDPYGGSGYTASDPYGGGTSESNFIPSPPTLAPSLATKPIQEASNSIFLPVMSTTSHQARTTIPSPFWAKVTANVEVLKNLFRF
jgi:hypothetical protein